ncbi:MAG: hypothetical protein Q9183_001327 [Haloplaca sp. 2 TL-2023]
MDNLPEDPPKDIDPYSTLNLSSSASAAEIRTAYKKLALKYHPDKAPPSEKSTAHTTFQNIAFAYAILSSPHRRTRYDTTGSTSETLASDDEGFDWLSFFQDQFSAISLDTFNEFSASYKNSEEEKRDVLAAYVKHKGKMTKLYQEVMLSNPLNDEDRFRAWIDDAIEGGTVEGYDAYLHETQKSMTARMNKARHEAEMAEQEKRSNPHLQAFFDGDGKGGGATTKQRGKGTEDMSLASIIQSRQQERQNGFFDRLEAKYAPKAKGGKRKAEEEPDEEAFARARARMMKTKGKEEQGGTAKANEKGKLKSMANGKGRRNAKAAKVEDEDTEEDDKEIDLEQDSNGDEDEEESDAAEGSEEEEEEVKPKQTARKGKAKKAAARTTAKRSARSRTKN